MSDENIINKIVQSLGAINQDTQLCRSTTIKAAVLVPLVKVDNEWNLLFTKRAKDIATHKGEISFPGGSTEKGDKDLVQTAIRETKEEIGIKENEVKILGVLDQIESISNYCVLPVVGIIELCRGLTLNPSEVEKLILIPVNWLLEANNWSFIDYVGLDEVPRKIIQYQEYNGEQVWGLTARITQNLLKLL